MCPFCILFSWTHPFKSRERCKKRLSTFPMPTAVLRMRSSCVGRMATWFVLQRIREVMKGKGFGKSTKIGGEGNELESDETFIGGIAKNMHKGRRLKADGLGPYKNKTIVQGILDRNLRKVRATVVPNVARETKFFAM